MKKKLLVMSFALSILLTGCESLQKNLEHEMIEQAGVSADTDYKTYQAYESEEKLTLQGYYSEDVFYAEMETEETPSNVASLSFATNNYIDISYFTDVEHTEIVEGQSIYLTQGQSIYAVFEVNSNAPSSMYHFDCFRLYQFKNGQRKLIRSITPNEEGLVISVDAEMINSDFSLEPIGSYDPRTIFLRDYYTDDVGIERDLAGTWLIDDKEVNEDEIEINPVSSYVISYKYDNDAYFFLSSTPEYYYTNHEDGIVIFELMEATNETYDYTVHLAEYLSVQISNTADRKVKVNEAELCNWKAGMPFSFNKLKYGDQVTVITDKEWSQLKNSRELYLLSETTLTDGDYCGYYKYTLIVPQKGGEFIFDPSEYNYEHGTVVFRCFGEVVTGIQSLAKGAKIHYTAGTVEDGYWLKAGTITVGEESETREALNSIRFELEEKVKVGLPQPTFGGKILYYANGKRLYGTSCSVPSGTVISMEFKPWTGWCSRCQTGDTFLVDDKDEKQVLTFSCGEDVNAIFYEASDHMPTLEVVLNKSVGTDMNLVVSVGEEEIDTSTYIKNWAGSDYVALEPQKIGTASGINLAFENRSLEAGTAVKILVDMEDTKGNKTSFSRLVNNLSAKIDPIMIYKESELGTSSVYYKTVKITISIVDANTFSAPKNPRNGNVEVRVVSTNAVLKTGDLIEPAEKVVVTITPNTDYYVLGKNVKNDIYQDTMKFSDYLKNVSGILSDHPIEKYVHMTLVESDSYGTATFKADNQTISGSVRLKVGQKLTITYVVTAEDYVIDGGRSGFLGIGKTDTKKTESIEVTSDLDGKTITRANFGISVAKGG